MLLNSISSCFRSWPWPFRVMWRHRSCDHSWCHRPFSVGGPWQPNLCLQVFSRYWPYGADNETRPETARNDVIRLFVCTGQDRWREKKRTCQTFSSVQLTNGSRTVLRYNSSSALMCDDSFYFTEQKQQIK